MSNCLTLYGEEDEEHQKEREHIYHSDPHIYLCFASFYCHTHSHTGILILLILSAHSYSHYYCIIGAYILRMPLYIRLTDNTRTDRYGNIQLFD